MYFSEYYKIRDINKEDWLDLDLEEDTNLFIDPVLVLDSSHPIAKVSAEQIISFFKNALILVDMARKTKNKNAISKVQDMLKFPEVHETGLGYAENSCMGSGISTKNALELHEALINFLEFGLENPIYIGTLSLFVEGIGPDRISDLVTNIIKKELIIYTQNICKKYNIPITKRPISHIEYDPKEERWINGTVELPINPFNKSGVILVPKEFLRKLPTFGLEDFWDYFGTLDSDELRFYATLGITKRISKEDLIAELIKNKESLLKILEDRLKEKPKPYDFEHDPLLLRIPYWVEKQSEKFARSINFSVFNKPTFDNFMVELLKHIKNMIEHEGIYKILYNDNEKPKNEKQVQKVIYAISKGFCVCSNVNIAPEVDTGSGLIDFQFSKGFRLKCLVEVKFVNSSNFEHGIKEQLPQYMEAQQINKSFILAICHTEDDLNKIPKAHELARDTSKKIEKEIILIPIDATPNKKTASKI